ncbi:MAG: addiction module protein [Luteolibacter sp.]|uniref:addiction module protein n=1 Tax=Luteolibacter sp. TaxID=1962973 RepID=UPI003265C107
MSLTEVAKLPLREKFQIMEAIWADLSERVERFENPPEHRQLFDARRARVAAGESTLHDWDVVKHSIGRR